VLPQGAFRYGGQIGDKGDYRVYAKYTDRSSFESMSGGKAHDDAQLSQSGFRADWSLSNIDSMSVHGDLYEGSGSQITTLISDQSPYRQDVKTPTSASGGNLFARWQREYSPTSEASLQFYYDRTNRGTGAYRESRAVYDLEYQRRTEVGKRHELTWGMGAHFTMADIGSTDIAQFAPRGTDSLYSAFIQDEISLKPDRVRLTIGSKFEQNSYTGFEIQPNVRLIYRPDDNRAIWTAISRAVRTPSQGESDVKLFFEAFDVGMPLLAFVIGNPDFKSEILTAYEIGYRVKPCNRLSLDFTAYYNHYDDMRTLEVGSPYPSAGPPFPHLVLPITVENLAKARSYGAELAATWIVSDRWRVMGGFSCIRNNFYHLPSSTDTSQQDVFEEHPPRNQYTVRSYLDLGKNTELDAILYCVDSSFGNSGALRVSGYKRLDLRLGWHPKPGLEVSFGGRNVFGHARREYGDPTQTVATEVIPTVYTKIAWAF
jgi:iron complex outermembrane recepter protein